MQKFKAGTAELGQRADVFVASKYPEFSRSSLNGLFEQGLVTINNDPAKASHKLKPGETVCVDDSVLHSEIQNLELPIIYEDDDVVVMHKPAGVLTHSKGAINTEATVASFLLSKITDKKLTSNRAGIVHRLDRATSGVIIGAKNERAMKYLQEQFSNRKTKKTYLAIVEGWPEPAEAIIDAPIERNPRHPQSFRVSASGKPAQTHYKTLKRLQKVGNKYTLLELRPTTGRTHQLRVHLSYIGHPIVGDRLYGHEGKNLLLHAKQLEITLPSSERKIFNAETPDYINEYIADD